MNRILYFLFFLCAFSIISCNQTPTNYLYEPAPAKTERMQWWEDARFGMFIHWGLYAIPAGEWNGQTNHAEWIRTTARIPLETYDGFLEEFNPTGYDPEQWVRTAKAAGMKYIVITSKHHDGFCLFDSDHTDFDVMATPYQQDILQKLADACHKEGIKICWYHSIMDWHHPDYLPRRGWENNRNSENADFQKYVDYLQLQLRELLTRYGDIGVLWFDGEWENTWTTELGKETYNYVRNLQPGIIINNRVDKGRSGMEGLTKPGDYAGDFGTPEQEIPATGLPGVYWETCMTMNNHWGYNRLDNHWKTPGELIRKLSDIASKGGNFLLNVGPKPDGTFPEESMQILNTMGKWMEKNGSSIYGTKASPFKSLRFGRCTVEERTEHTRLFLHVFDWPANGRLKVPGIFNAPQKAFFLADPARDRLNVYRQEDGIIIQLPREAPDSINTVIALDVAGKPDISNPPVIDSENGVFVDLISLNITSDNPNLKIRYTLDGSIPDHNSPMVEGPLTLEDNAEIVARCFRDNQPASDTTRAVISKVNPIPPVRTQTLTSGLVCEYFEGVWDTLPDFESLTPLKQIAVDAFTLEHRDTSDHYGFVFEGYIEIPEDGVYEFYTESDDGSQLYLNEMLVVDNDGLHGLQSQKGVAPLGKGFHKIKVLYFEKSGDDALNVFYDGPGFDKRKIPVHVLFRDGQQ